VDRRQQNFLYLAVLLVALLTITLSVINSFQNRAQPQPFPTAQPSATPLLTATTVPARPAQTVVSTPTLVSSTPPGAITPTPSATPTAEMISTATPLPQREFFVAPDGRVANNGSRESPWPLQYVLDMPETIQPGDTIWMLGGEYTGPFATNLQGTEEQPITLRAEAGSRVILKSSDLVLDIQNSRYVNYWGFEIAPTENSRDPQKRPESAYGIRIHQGRRSHHLKFINIIIHDMPAQGIGWWHANKNSEIYGSLIFYNGVNQFDHGIYVNNIEGAKRMVDNIIFDNASHGIHAYSETGPAKLNNLYLEGNTLFDNGSIGYTTNKGKYGIPRRNILIGGNQIAQSPTIIDNYTYYPDLSGESLNLGYRAGSMGATVENNYLAGGRLFLGGINEGMLMKQNTILGLSLPEVTFSQNSFLVISPTDPKVFLRPNQYEPGRANVTIYNWDRRPVVHLSPQDLQAVGIRPGDRWELRSVQDYFSDILTGTYEGSGIDVPMTGRSVAQPMGLSFKPPSTFPEFGAFVLFVNPPSPAASR
jgi:hypothetical protein